MNTIEKNSIAYSYLGRRVLDRDVEAARFLYGNIWEESPPLIRTISDLQECLTIEAINENTDSYSSEFLYYWGMTCLGEQSPLIAKELKIAKACFHAIKDAVPHAEARLAYIELLQSTEPARSDSNVRKLAILRKWASKMDLFSRIILAKISFYSFLCEEQTENSGPPIKTLKLLELPLQMGHPVAIRFLNDIYACMEKSDGILDKQNINAFTLYDFKNICKYANRPVTVEAQRVIFVEQSCN